MTSMAEFTRRLDRSDFAPLNGKRDPFDVLSTLRGDMATATEAMRSAGVFGWNVHVIPLSGMDETGMYSMPDTIGGIVAPGFPGGPAVFGSASLNWQPIQQEQVLPLADALVSQGLKLTHIVPGSTTRYVFEGDTFDIGPAGTRSVGDPIRDRWVAELGNTGKHSFRIKHAPLRLACTNGMVAPATVAAISINHSSLAPAKIDATVHRIMAAGGKWMDVWVREARQAMGIPMTLETALAKWSKLFDWDANAEGRALTMQENQTAQLTQLWRSPTQTATGSADTAWSFFNATAEYLDHGAVVRFNGGTRETALASRVVNGTTDRVKSDAWAMALSAR